MGTTTPTQALAEILDEAVRSGAIERWKLSRGLSGTGWRAFILTLPSGEVFSFQPGQVEAFGIGLREGRKL